MANVCFLTVTADSTNAFLIFKDTIFYEFSHNKKSQLHTKTLKYLVNGCSGILCAT